MLTISVRRSGAGGWSVCRRSAALFSNLTLEQAIRLARVVARDEHQRLHRPICVDMPGNHNPIVLARYAGLDDHRARGELVA